MSEQAQKVFNIQRVYLKDASLETPNGYKVFLLQNQPELNINLTIEKQQIEQTVWEVALRLTLQGDAEKKTQFLLEAQYAGIFDIQGFSAEEIDQIVNVDCAAILMPYLRAYVSLSMSQMTLPTFHLPEINFMHMFIENRKNAAEAPVATLH